MHDEFLIICPNSTKINILEKISEQKRLTNIKFMDINEFIDNYFYNYSNETVSYIMDNYGTNINISRIYLENLYSIDINKKYKSNKISFLQNLKKELIERNLLDFNYNFKEYLKNKNVKVVNYPKLEKYIVNIFDEIEAQIITKKIMNRKIDVTEANSVIDELDFVFDKIIKLYKKGVSLNKIFIVNISDEYLYNLDKFSKCLDIPINISAKNSILSTVIVKKYLNDKIIPEINSNNEAIVNKLIDIKNKLVAMEDNKYYDDFLLEELQNTYMDYDNYSQCIQVCDLFDREFLDDEYVFVMNFNDLALPIMYKDEDYLTDIEKEEVEMYSTAYKNTREKEVVISYLTNIKNLTISYKLTSFKDKFYPSSLIKEYNMNITKYVKDNYNYSNKYNKRLLSIYLDNYYKYGEESKYLKSLYKTYENELTYGTYSNLFTKIDNSVFLESFDKIGLSYTSMNSYNECKFKYYINYILKLDPFEETFKTLIGNLFHYVLEKSMLPNFDFDDIWAEYLKGKELQIKEKFFLEKLKKNLEDAIEIIKEQKMYSTFKENFVEKSIYIPLECSKKEAYFSGKIDKIMYKDDNYAIVDYKTGGYDSNLCNMKYGLGMQLATYLFLIEKGKIFKKPQLAGMYFQKVLVGTVKKDDKKEYFDKLKDEMKLVGYSTDNEEILELFDKNYVSSNVIRGMKVGSNGFYKYTKLLTKEEEKNIIDYTEKIIYKTLGNILDGDFPINPKKINFNDVSCSHCKYKDLCYRTEDDYINLEKQEDLSFLGGEYCG